MQRPSNYNSGQTLGQYIRSTREEVNITLTAFAKELGVSKSYLSDVERGNRKITKTRLAHIAYRFIRYLPGIICGKNDEQRWLAMFQFLLNIGRMMSYEYMGLLSIAELLDKPKLKGKFKLEAIKIELDVVFMEDYMSWKVCRDTKE